jgi:hypothetical protein
MEGGMRAIVVAIAIALLTVPSFGQGMGGGKGSGGHAGPPEKKEVVDPEKKKADEKAFKDAVDRIPVSDKKFDPWGSVRQSGK